MISYNIHILVTAGNKKTSMFLPFPTPIGLLGKDEIMKVHVPAVPPYFLPKSTGTSLPPSRRGWRLRLLNTYNIVQRAAPEWCSSETVGCLSPNQSHQTLKGHPLFGGPIRLLVSIVAFMLIVFTYRTNVNKCFRGVYHLASSTRTACSINAASSEEKR